MKILLIEYEPRYLERIRGYLAGKDVELVVARDGDEGLEHYRRSRPDLVLVSSVLPRLRTPDVIRGMQAAGSTPPILLMMSGYKGRNKRADAQRIGATSILEKPFGEEIFNAEIQAALGLHPVLDLPPSRSVPESGEPLLSADDIFSDVLSGIDEDIAVAAPPAAPPPSPLPPPGIDPALQRRLETTLSGLIPPRKGESSPGFVRPRSDAPRTSGEVPAPGTAETMKVNLGDLPPGDRPPERAKSGAGTAASVDKLLHDTLSGLRIKSKPGTGSGLTDPGVTAPTRPVSSASAPALSPTAVPAPEPSRERVVPPPIAPAPALLPSDATPLAPLPVNTIATPAPPPPVPVRIPSHTARPPSGPGAFGRYQLLERIASGGMADVFKARMTGEEGFEKIVAIKRILPHLATNEGFITMFVDEAKLAAQLSHNNIIHIYELGKVDAWHYIAMEYVDGKDLRSIVKMGRDRSFPLPVELSLFIASRIANALDYAHRRVAPDGTELNLVHRDVSPQNILISWEGDIKLCDFGVAKAATKVSTTMSGALKGKLQYMSPEQAWGKKIDRRSDIFSLGAVLFELLTGLPLFEGENDMTILEKVRDGQVEPPSARNPEVPRKVDQIVLKALAKNALDRYQNASELEKDLLSVLYGYQPSPGPADLAIYVHRLLETPHSTSDDDIDAAFAAAQAAPRDDAVAEEGKGARPREERRAHPASPDRPHDRSRDRDATHGSSVAKGDAAPDPRRRSPGRTSRGGRVEEEPHRAFRRYRRRGGRPRGRGCLYRAGPWVRAGAGRSGTGLSVDGCRARHGRAGSGARGDEGRRSESGRGRGEAPRRRDRKGPKGGGEEGRGRKDRHARGDPAGTLPRGERARRTAEGGGGAVACDGGACSGRSRNGGAGGRSRADGRGGGRAANGADGGSGTPRADRGVRSAGSAPRPRARRRKAERRRSRRPRSGRRRTETRPARRLHGTAGPGPPDGAHVVRRQPRDHRPDGPRRRERKRHRHPLDPAVGLQIC